MSSVIVPQSHEPSENRTRNKIALGYALLDEKLHIIEPGSLRLFIDGSQIELLQGKSIFQIFPGLDKFEEQLRTYVEQASTGSGFSTPVGVEFRNTRGHPFYLHFETIFSVQGILVIVTDLSLIYSIEYELNRSRKQLDEIRDRLSQQVHDFAQTEARLFESSIDLRETRQLYSDRVARLEALHKISAALSFTLETKPLLELIVEQAARLLNADSCSVALLDPETGELVFHAAVDAIIGKRIPPGEGIMFRSLQGGSAQIVQDVQDDPDHYKQTGEESNLRARSMLAVPLQAPERNIGVLAAVNRKPTNFSIEDRDLLVTMASYAAIAIENASLFEQVQQQKRDLEIKVAERTAELRLLYQRQAALAEIELSINQESELQKVLDKIVSETQRLVTPAGHSIIVLWDEENQVYTAGASTSAQFPTGYILDRLRKEGGASQWIIKHIQPMVERDVRKPEFALPNPIMIEGGLRSYAGVPLSAEGKALGVLYALDQQCRDYSNDVVDFLVALASRAAIAIVKVKLYEAERAQRAQAETLREAGAIVAETLRQNEAIERILRELARVIPYDSACVLLLRDGYLEIVGGNGWLDEQAVVGLTFPIPGDNPNTVVILKRRHLVLSDARQEYAPFQQPPHDHIRSWLGVPLIVHDTVIGMLALDKKEVNYFTPRHAELALAFADQVAVAIENARLFETTQQNAFEAKTARDILHRLTSVQDLIEAFPEVTEGLKAFTKCTRITLALLSSDQETFTMVALDQPRAELSQGVTMPAIATSAAEDILAGRIHFTPDLSEEIHFPAEKILYEGGTRARMNIPLQTPDGIIGALNFSWDELQVFKKEQIPILSQIADAIALAVQKERLYKAQREWVDKLEELRAAVAKISSQLELPLFLDTVLERAVFLINATAGEFGTFHEERNLIEISAYHNMDRDYRGSTIHLGEGVIGHVARTQAPLILHDYKQFEGRFSKFDDGPWRGMIASPIMLRDKLLGVIVLADTRPERNFSSSDLQLLRLFSDQIAISLENARLFQEVQTLATIDELTGILNRRRMFELGKIEFEKARRYSIPLSAIMIDIDHFKKINDTFGHITGDQVMRILARRCQQIIRGTDVFGRYGGEEFTILLPHTDKANTLLLAERLRTHIAHTPFQTERGEISITISLGVATLTEDIIDLASLIDRADTALLVAKNLGRNRIEEYQP